MKNLELISTATAPSVHDHVIQKPITWENLAEYLSSPKVGAKQGNGFVAAEIDDGPRKNERVRSASLLVYDLDNKDSIVTANDLDSIVKKNGFKAIIHSTYSHTPEAPRFRLILAVSEPLSPAEHKRVLLQVADQLGIAEAIDKNATDLSRFFFRPRCPLDQLENYVFRSIDGAPVDIPLIRSTIGGKVIELISRREVDTTTANLMGGRDWSGTAENIGIVRQMLSSVPPNCERDDWKKIIWSVLSLDWDVGEELVTDWSKRSEEHWGDVRVSAKASIDLERVITDYDPSQEIGIGTLWHHAEANGWKHEPANMEESIDGKAEVPRFKILSPSDLYNLPPMEWLVKGLLPAQGLAAIYGAPGSGKSFLALDIAMAISEGLPTWFGRTIQQRKVVYLALEGSTGIGKRIKAWEIHNGQPADNLNLIIDSFNLKSPADVAALVEVIQQQVGAGCVVFIDTLNQASPGSDENSSVDMGLLLAAAKAIYVALNGLVILVHHSGKNAQNGLRGHSSMNGAMDTVILVQKLGMGGHVWSIDKVKDADGSVKESFDLVSCNVGTDAAGLPETSCAVHPSGLTLFDSKPRGKHQKPVYAALEAKLKSGEQLTYEEALEGAKLALSSLPSKNRADRAKTALTGLIDGGHLMQDEECISLP